jgi:hypothetical protein
VYNIYRRQLTTSDASTVDTVWDSLHSTITAIRLRALSFRCFSIPVLITYTVNGFSRPCLAYPFSHICSAYLFRIPVTFTFFRAPALLICFRYLSFFALVLLIHFPIPVMLIFPYPRSAYLSSLFCLSFQFVCFGNPGLPTE